jgi:hypothetical protein
MAVKKRIWATIVYPESAPDDWKDVLEDEHIPAYISPIHTDSTKDHYHIVIIFEGQKSENDAKEVFHKIGGVGAEPVKHKSAYLRYLCHLDSKDKPHYDPNEVSSLSGAPLYANMIQEQNSTSDIYAEMLEFIRNNGVVTFCDLVDYAREHEPSWFSVLVRTNSSVVWYYLKSLNWKIRSNRVEL